MFSPSSLRWGRIFFGCQNCDFLLPFAYMMRKGKFIVLEGIDGAGKSTQFVLLQQALEERGYSVKTLDFPRYQDSLFGGLCKRMLEGEFGALDKISPYLGVLPYMIDQVLMAPAINEWLIKGYMVVSNRYFTSNFGHQVGKLPTEKHQALREWLQKAGYDELGIVKEDVVLFFDVAPSISSHLVRTRTGRSRDEAEKSAAHQKRSYEAFLEAIDHFPHWIRVECMKDGKILPQETIHQSVCTILGI